MLARRRPGEIRDAIFSVLSARPNGASVKIIEQQVRELIGAAAGSSVRSYLRLNTPSVFVRTARAHYALKSTQDHASWREDPALYRADRNYVFGRATVVHADCIEWLRQQHEKSIHAVVTDPPYGLFEYSAEQQRKLRAGKGGVWRIPPSYDGTPRSPFRGSRCSQQRTCAALNRSFLNGLWP